MKTQVSPTFAHQNVVMMYIHVIMARVSSLHGVCVTISIHVYIYIYIYIYKFVRCICNNGKGLFTAWSVCYNINTCTCTYKFVWMHALFKSVIDHFHAVNNFGLQN